MNGYHKKILALSFSITAFIGCTVAANTSEDSPGDSSRAPHSTCEQTGKARDHHRHRMHHHKKHGHGLGHHAQHHERPHPHKPKHAHSHKDGIPHHHDFTFSVERTINQIASLAKSNKELKATVLKMLSEIATNNDYDVHLRYVATDAILQITPDDADFEATLLDLMNDTTLNLRSKIKAARYFLEKDTANKGAALIVLRELLQTSPQKRGLPRVAELMIVRGDESDKQLALTALRDRIKATPSSEDRREFYLSVRSAQLLKLYGTTDDKEIAENILKEYPGRMRSQHHTKMPHRRHMH